MKPEISISKSELRAFEKRLNNQATRLEDDFKAETLITSQEVVKRGRKLLDSGGHNVTGNLRGSLRQKDVSRLLGRTSGTSRTVTARGRKGNHLHFLVRGTANRHNGIRNTGKVRNTNDFLATAQDQARARYETAIRMIANKKREV